MPNTQHRLLMRRPLPTKEFTRALGSLRQDISTPITVLKDLLDLGAAPENVPQVATDSKIVPTCMGLLQQHCTRSRIFGENDYGVICICLIALRVEVNLLESIGCSFDDNDDVDYDGPTTNLRTLEDDISNAIAGGYQTRRPEDPPDLFRTSVGLVHTPPVLTADQAGRLLDYLHGERDSFLRARVSGTSDWAGWPFLFHALWEMLVFRNNDRITRVTLKLLDICYRFMIVKPSAAVMLEHLIARIKINMSPTDVVPAPVNPSDRQQITRAYINRLTNDFDPPTMQLSHAFFNWVALALDATRADLVVEFTTTSCDRLWGVLEDMRTCERLELVQINHGMRFATDIIAYIRGYLTGDVVQFKFAKDITELLKQTLRESDIISLIARVLLFPTFSTELETLSDTDKHYANIIFNAFFKSMGKLADTMSRHSSPSCDFFNPLMRDWLKSSQQIREAVFKYNRAAFTYNYLTKCQRQWSAFGSVLFASSENKSPIGCSYPRCPLPPLAMESMHMCENCRSAIYCCHRCQYLHWCGTAAIEPHAETCRATT